MAEELFATLSLFDEPTVTVVEGTLGWIPLRRRLGGAAFGTNAYRAARAGDLVVEEHAEGPGQEEMYVVVRGAMRFTVDGTNTDLGHGEVVFVPDPKARRKGVALADDTVVLAVGGWVGEPYRELPWEPIFLASAAIERGDWQEALDTLEREAGALRGNGYVRFRIACCEAQLGESDRALEELQAAIEDKPRVADMAANDELIAPLRDHPRWPLQLRSGR